MNRIIFIGMDLSGKSINSSNVAKALGLDVRKNLLTRDKTKYNQAVNKMKSENSSDEEALSLFNDIYQDDLNNFQNSLEEQNTFLVQDNLGIIRNIANFYYKGYDVKKLINILKSYEQPAHCFYLTCSGEERIKRLEERNNKQEDIYEKLLRENPKAFFALNDIAYDICSQYFDCEQIDNTNITVEETAQYVLKKVMKK